MSDVKFVSELPATAAGAAYVPQLINTLAERPGEWAEIARFPRGDNARAVSRGSYMKSKDSHVQTATRTVNNEVVLFARWDA